MHAGVIAYRKAEAQGRTVKALGKLTKKFGLDVDPESLNPTGNDIDVVDMLRTEAVADLLEAIAKKVASSKPAPVVAVEPIIEAAPVMPEDQAFAEVPAKTKKGK